MFEQSNLPEPTNSLSDWAVRAGFALLFISAGAEKFGSNSGWTQLFQQIGVGQWFRYFTGVVEIVGAAFLLIPWTVTAGVALLACTLAVAALLWIFRLGHPGNAVVSGAFLGALVIYWCARRNRQAYRERSAEEEVAR
jgi:putative oxidoreductase